MKNISIKGIKNLLKSIQENFYCTGEISIISDNLPIPESLRKKLDIKADAKVFFACLGYNNVNGNSDPSDPYYFVYVENEGGAVFSFPHTTQVAHKLSFTLSVSDDGELGYAKNEKVVLKPFIFWEDGRAKAKVESTGEVMELADVPNTPIMGNVLKFLGNSTFPFASCIFGHPNLISRCPSDGEWGVAFVDGDTGETNNWVSDQFIFEESISKMRKDILKAGEKATPKAIEKIFDKY